MKKIIAIAVILAGVVLFTIGNTIQMYSTISILEKRLAEKEHAVDTVEAKVDTLTFEEEMAFVEGMADSIGKFIDVNDFLKRKDVEYNDDDYSAITAVRYKNGMPKIVISFYYDSKRGGYVRKPIARSHFFLEKDGTKLAFSFDGGRHWACWQQTNDNRFVFTNPNLCRNLNLK